MNQPAQAVRIATFRSTPSSARAMLLVRVAAATAVTLGLAACGDGQPPGSPPVPPTQVAAVDTPPPAYPIELACDDIGGKVVLMLTIGTEGRPTASRIVSSSGVPQLDAAAQEAVRDWQFHPATRNGRPVEMDIQVPMTFNPPTMRPDECFVLDEQRP